jgi:hypothetical protein
MTEQHAVPEEDEGARYRELVSQAFSHLEKGEALAPPPERSEDPLDRVISGVIGALRAETRLYPEAYAWIVSEAVRDALLSEEVDQELTEDTLTSLEAAQRAAEGIPALYPRSRLLTLLRGVWDAGWRPVTRPQQKTAEEER